FPGRTRRRLSSGVCKKSRTLRTFSTTRTLRTSEMAESLGNLTRTHTCGALRTDDVGASAVLLGWVHRVRDLGGVTFIDVRDRAGVSQVVVRESDTLMPIAKRLRSEFVVAVSGVVQRRSAETVNAKIATGEVEVLAREIRILNEAKTPPFQIADDAPVSEDV